MKYIGIDLGSSFIKAVLIDIDKARIIDQSNEPAPRKIQNPNKLVFEIPALKLVNIVKSLIDHYTRQYPDITGIVISSQMHGFIYSAEGREDVYISWQDMRCLVRIPGTAQTYLDFLTSKISPSQMENTGVYLKPSLAICNLYTLLRENKDISRKGTLYSLGSYIIYSLCGNNFVHIQNAAPMGIADVKNGSINHELLRKLDLDEIELPKITDGDYVVCGDYQSNGCRIQIFPDYGDMQMAIAGCNVGTGDVIVNTSTGSQVMRFAQSFVPGEYEIRPFFDHSYLYTISNMPAGRNLAVLIDFFREIVKDLTGEDVNVQKIWEIIHAGHQEPDADLRVKPDFYKNPYFPNGGSITGITQNNLHISTLFAASIDDMAHTYWKFIQKLGEEEKNIKRIICAGGVNWRTPELCKAIGNVSGKPWVLSPVKNEAVLGLLRIALICSEKYASLAECVENIPEIEVN